MRQLLKIILLPSLLLILYVQPVNGQQDPILTQYMFNTLALNPAYAGTGGVLNAMITTRHQWVGFDDAPSTQTFTIHTPVSSANFGAGLSFIHDKIGPVTNTTAFLDYAYHLHLNRQVKLSLGLKGGFSHYQKDLSRYITEVGADDNAYSEPSETSFLPNFGFGAYAWSGRFYFGLSIPRLIENQFDKDKQSGSTLIPKENRLYMLMGGLAIPIHRELVLKPSFILRATNSAPLSGDVNLSLLIRDRLWTGAMWRPGEAVGLILQYRITDQLSAGYAYDITTHKLLSQFGNTHEIMVSFELNFQKERVLNPRYF
jgi:type IX secretion system PorP/SprF family membrane protein